MTREQRLEQFFRALWDCHTGSIEGDDIESLAEEYGLVECVVVTEACREVCCICAEFGFPAYCFRLAKDTPPRIQR